MEQGGEIRVESVRSGSWDTGDKLGQSRATGVMTRSPNDCSTVLLYRNMEISVPQKYGRLRHKGNKLEAVSNFPQADQHVLPSVREIRFQAEKSRRSLPAWEAFCISQTSPWHSYL